MDWARRTAEVLRREDVEIGMVSNLIQGVNITLRMVMRVYSVGRREMDRTIISHESWQGLTTTASKSISTQIPLVP